MDAIDQAQPAQVVQQQAILTLAAPMPLAQGKHVTTVWNELEDNAEGWTQFNATGDTDGMGLRINERDRDLLAHLQHFPVVRWVSLCDGAGWSAIAVAALSWCKGRTLRGVLIYWRALGRWPEPNSPEERAASLINPALLPENRLSELIAAGKDAIGLAVLIAARAEPPVMDIYEAEFTKLQMPPIILTLIDSRQEAANSNKAGTATGAA